MYRHFLVPLGGTDAAIAALGHALEFARSIGARVTFFHACSASGHEGDQALAQNHVKECFAKAEAAARAQGVPCGTILRAQTDSGAATLLTFVDAARMHGCDLVCASQDTPCMDSRSQSGELFVACAIPVLICAVQGHASTERAIGALLAGHREISSQLYVLLDHVHTLISRGAQCDATTLRSLAVALRTVPALRHWPNETRLFARLRERTSALDAELAELERQHRHEIRLIDQLIADAGAIAESEPLPAVFEQRLQTCAQFIWERMGREGGVILPAARRYLSDADWEDSA
jgi:hypothetical protein